jgi:hypothetical protein
MNERIRELVEKSYIYDKQNDSSFFNKEKFAELIVRECAGKVDWILAEGGKTQGDMLKEHFYGEEL